MEVLNVRVGGVERGFGLYVPAGAIAHTFYVLMFRKRRRKSDCTATPQISARMSLVCIAFKEPANDFVWRKNVHKAVPLRSRLCLSLPAVHMPQRLWGIHFSL